MARGLKLADLAFLGRVGANGGFTPPDLANLFLWVRPESLSGHADGDPVNTWPDESGLGNDLQQSGSPTVQTNELNGYSGVSFLAGTSDSLGTTVAGIPAHTEYTFFIVKRDNSAAGTGTILHVGSVNGYVALKDTGNREIVHRGIAALVDAAETTSAELWTARKTAVPMTTLRVNTANQGLTNSGSNVAANEDLLTLGQFIGAGLFFSGFIFEVLCYKTNLSDANRDIVEAYLMAKYAL